MSIMNISVLGGGTNSGSGSSSNTIFVGKLPMFQNTGLKSTREKLERQQKANSQIEYWESQKENLKEMKCEDVGDISRKLSLLQLYEDEVTAAKVAYNNGQMFHVLDEAKEMGEKIAEAVEKMEPKTPEERREEILEEMAENIPGAEESDGVLEEIVEESAKLKEELQEQLEDEEAVSDNLEEMTKQVQDMEITEKVPEEVAVKPGNMLSDVRALQEEEERRRRYKPFDTMI